ncbi:MAG: hypothetical protein NC548_63735, partial [Lachnospiraceae bacterium]|nr:hypothetical protein [Lachnospiraceae bacterium]
DLYSAAGKGFDDLLKDINDATDAIDTANSSLNALNGTQATTNVDSSQAVQATNNINAATTAVNTHTDTNGKTNIDSGDAVLAESNTDAATASVEIHDATEGKTHIDSSDSVKATENAMAVNDELDIMGKTEVDPVVKTTWLDRFLSKLKSAWDGLMEFMGLSDEEKAKNKLNIDNSSNPTPQVTAFDLQKQREEAKAKREAAIAEMYKKARAANTDKEFADAKRTLNEYKKNLKRDSAEYKRVVKELELLDKRDKKTSGKKDKSGSKDDPKQREYELKKQQIEEEKRLAQLRLDEENRQEELRISQMEDNYEKELATIRLNEKKKREALIKERQEEADRLKKFDLDQWLKGGKGRKAYDWKQTKTDEQYLEDAGILMGFDTQSAQITSSSSDEFDKVYRNNLSAMRDYLKQYGTFQQKKLAIAQEYAEKIRLAQNEGKKLTLQAQEKSDLQAVEDNALMSQIDWYSVFDNVGIIMQGQLEPLYKKLQDYVKTDEFRKSGADNQAKVIEAMENLRQQLGDNKSWYDLASALTSYQGALNELQAATEKDAKITEEMGRLMAIQTAAQANLTAANNHLADVTNNPNHTDAELQEANEAVTQATAQVAVASQAVDAYGATVRQSSTELQNAQNAVQSFGTMLSQTAKSATQPISKVTTFLSTAGLSQLAELWGAFDQLKGGINGLKALNSKQVQDTGDAAKSLGDGAKEAGETIAKDLPKELTDGLGRAGLIGQIIAAVLKILDILKDGIGTLISSILDSIFQAISGIIDNILSGELFKQIGESLYKGILGIFKSIFTMGGLFDWWGNGESDKNLEKDIERLTNTNDALRKTVDNLADVMQDSAVAEAADIYAVQKSNIEQSMANTQEMMSRAGAAYSNGFLGIGGKHSSNKKINDAMSKNEWARISKIVGETVNSASDFWNLTSEQMAKVAQDAPDLYGKIKQYADDGHKDAAQFMDEYIEYYKQLEELETAYRERLTDVSLDSVKDEFKSMLLDMESDAEDFAESFEKLMQQAVINSLMSSKYNERIQKWYEDFAAAMEGDDATITAAEQARLKREWDDIVADA